MLGELKSRLEAYLVEWRRQLGIQERTEASIDRDERRPAAAERKKKGVESPPLNRGHASSESGGKGKFAEFTFYELR